MTKLRIDYHVHESHSGDAKESTIKDYIMKAEIIGIDEIAFTTHLLFSTPDIHISIKINEIESYIKEIEQAQQNTSVSLLKGFEVDYIPSDEKKIEKIIDEYSLDIILGSVHYVNGNDIGSKSNSIKYFKGRALSKAADEYYGVWKQAVETGLFDVMAHPDYWRKHVAQVHPRTLKWIDYGSTINSALDSLLSYGVGLEINTSGFKHGLGTNFPLDCLLQAAKNRGVNNITIGSDSHKISELGNHYEDAVSQIRRIGYDKVTRYKDRKPAQVGLTTNLLKEEKV